MTGHFFVFMPFADECLINVCEVEESVSVQLGAENG